MLVSALAVATVIAACGSDGAGEPERTLTIYVSQPTTGGRGGQDTITAVEIEVANQGSRIGEAEIEVVGLNDADPDGQFDPALVRANARRAAADPNTIAYIGGYDSGGTKLAMPILNRAGILHVSSGSTAVKLTMPSPELGEALRPTGIRTFSRVIPSDTVQAAALTEFMEEESVKSVFVLNDGGTYGAGLQEYFELAVRPSGIRIAASETVGARSDMAALAAQVDASGSDALLFAGSHIDVGLDLFEAVHRADPSIKLFGGDGISLSGFIESLGDIELDTYVTAPTLPSGNYALSGEEFLNAFRESSGRDAESVAIFGYEAGEAVIDSIRNGLRGDIGSEAISTLRKSTRDAFFSISERPSALGSYSIDADGDTSLTFYGAYRVENGELVLGRAIDVPP
jgi:branched-chain amino acid transport system substrate-binding protein